MSNSSPIPTTVLSLTASSLLSSALTPSCSTLVCISLCTLLRGFLSVVRTPTKLHPLAPSSCPTPSHHRHLPPTSRARVCQIQSHLPSDPGDLIFAWSSSSSRSRSRFLSSPFSSSQGCSLDIPRLDFFRSSNDCSKCRCFGPADASITARHCTLRSSIFEISL